MKINLSYTRWFLLVLIIITSFIILHFAFSQRENNLRIAFLDVGQGDSIFIESPNGRQVLIDGGINRGVLNKLGEVMPFYDRSIDVVIGTHPDADHIGGLVDVLSDYDVEIYMDPKAVAETEVYSSLLQVVGDEKINYLQGVAGQVINLGDGVRLEILFPNLGQESSDKNDYSIVAKLIYRENEVLLTGDAGRLIEMDLVEIYGEELQADILKIGHHGSKTSSSKIFLKTVSPHYAIISAGCDNNFDHPHDEVMEALKDLNIQILETCDEGNIIFEGDGERFWVE